MSSAQSLCSMNTLEIIGIAASVITIVSFLYSLINSKRLVRWRIERKQRKIQNIENRIFLLERNPLALMQINRLRTKQGKLRSEIYDLQQDL